MAKIKKIKLGSTTYDLCDAAATHKVDGVTGSTVTHFGSCSTGASTAAKTVSITAGTFSLETGAKVTVKFANKNTAGTPTLNVNSTGAKNIFHNGAQITTGGNKSLLYGTVDFVYDGTQWQLIGNYVDTNTHNSHTLSSGTKVDGTTEIVGASSSGKLTLGASGVTQGAYGPTETESASVSGTIKIPEITVNDKGIVTAAVERSVSLPSISIPNKSSSDTTDLVYAVSNLVESGVNGHTITPTYSGLPTKAYVDKVATGHVKYLGTATALTSLSTTAGQGDFYRVSTAFTFGSETAHVGDIILATKDNPAQNTTDWDLIHTEINTNTWTANTKTNAGYVSAPTADNPYRVWQTDSGGNPAWRIPKEAYLDWGGRSITGGISPVGASLSSEHSANRLAYLNPAALLFEYSDNAGSSWTDLQWSDDRKVKHVTTSESLHIGASPTVTTSHSSRMTLTAQNGTNGYIYTRPKKLLINMSTNGHGVTATLEYKTGVSGAAWQTLGTYAINGWSGWNEIDVSSLYTLGGGSTQNSNNWYWRLTYRVTSVSESYKSSRPYIIGLRLFGDTCWTRTSNMGETGHLYSYDWEQNATFPAKVTATKFIGPLEGTATTATKLSNTTAIGSTTNPVYFTSGGVPSACTYSLNKTVPSDAVFTDTKVTQASAITTNGEYPVLLANSTATTAITGTVNKTSTLKYNPSTSTLTATKFKGNLEGVATQADKATQADEVAVSYTPRNNTNEIYEVLLTPFSGDSYATPNKDSCLRFNATTDAFTDPYTGKNFEGGSKLLIGSDSHTDCWYYDEEYGGYFFNNSNAGTGHLEVAGNLIVGGGSDNYGIFPAQSNYSKIGDSDHCWYEIYASNIYQNGSRVLTSHQIIKQDGITGATITRYGACSTAASTAAKTVSITSGTFTLSAGARVTVKFTYANTASTPTLNVNSKGAKNIYHKGAQITTGSNKSLLAGVCDFVYDGTQWHLVGNYIDTNTNTNYYHTTGSWSDLTYTATANGGAGALAFTLPTGTSATTVALGNHTHTCSIKNSSGTAVTSLAHGTTYTLTAGDTSVNFTMPSQYSHPTTAGNKHIPSGGAATKMLKYSSSGTVTWDYIANVVYPVGSIYMSVTSTSPATLFGGTWVQLKDRFLLGAGDTYSNAATGGSATHTLTQSELPNKQLGLQVPADRSGYSGTLTITSEQGSYKAEFASGSALKAPKVALGASASAGTLKTEPLGSGSAHNNMPPYLVVYMWKRTA